MDRGAWWDTVHGVAKSQTQLSRERHFQSSQQSSKGDALIVSILQKGSQSSQVT